MEAITLVLEEDRSSSSSSWPGWQAILLDVWEREKGSAYHVHAYAYLTLSAFHNAAHAHSGSPVPYSSVPAVLHCEPHWTSPLFPTCSRVCQPLVVWEVGFPGGTAQVAVMSLGRSASRTICPGFCPYFIYVMVHLVNTTLPATLLLITTCWHSFNLFL